MWEDGHYVRTVRGQFSRGTGCVLLIARFLLNGAGWRFEIELEFVCQVIELDLVDDAESECARIAGCPLREIYGRIRVVETRQVNSMPRTDCRLCVMARSGQAESFRLLRGRLTIL